jgi:phosphoribosylformylglycinamidine cyclo-ligase
VTEQNFGASYSDAGVDIEAGERAVSLMRDAVAATNRPEVVGTIGGFSGLFDASRLAGMRRPLLATSTDGVGTKVAISQQLGIHDTIGVDLVAMVADDLVVCGAEPLFLTDYIACGRVVPERIASIVEGIAQGCRDAGCALLGGETAEHPGLLEPDQYDLAGAATGVVEAAKVLGADKVRAGDIIVAIGSSGLHANGFSLVRRVLLEMANWKLGRHVDELGRTLGEELLEPTLVYSKACLNLAADVDIHAFAHITGGGIPGNLSRVLPDNLDAVIDRSSWRPPTIFNVVREAGSIDLQEMERTFNMGVGMVALLPEGDADAAINSLENWGMTGWVAGRVQLGNGLVQLTGRFA